jgi:hypothetical protein
MSIEASAINLVVVVSAYGTEEAMAGPDLHIMSWR